MGHSSKCTTNPHKSGIFRFICKALGNQVPQLEHIDLLFACRIRDPYVQVAREAHSFIIGRTQLVFQAKELPGFSDYKKLVVAQAFNQLDIQPKSQSETKNEFI